MEKTIIKSSEGSQYLSEFMEDLPHNCLLSKSLAGCGGTSLALSNSENYIICSPFVSLIECKCAQKIHKNVLGVYGKFKPHIIKRYLNNKNIPVKKIMVTYDSLPKLMELLNPQDFRLLVDEIHLLFQAYCFRSSAISGVLNNYHKFKSYTFMTATMLEDEFILTELQHLPVVEVEWENVKEITVSAIRCKSDVIHTTVELINRFLSGDIEGNAHIFVNSVLFIRDLVKSCKLTDSNARAIWSINNPNKTGLLKSNINSDVKKINFYTSTCFEGVDIFDEEGKTYIISDGNKAHSLLDISTSFQQVINRVRDSNHKYTVTHIYSSTRYDIDLTYEEYKLHLIDEIAENKEAVDYFNLSPNKTATNLINKSLSSDNINSKNTFISFVDEKFIVDYNLVKFDMYNFKVTKHLYKLRVNLNSAYKGQGFNVNDSVSDTYLHTICKTTPKDTFRETVIELENKDPDFIKWAYQRYPFLEDAVKYIGFQGMKDLDYHLANIRKTALNKSNKTTIEKAKSYFETSSKFKVGNFYSFSETKEIISNVYNDFEITAKPSASDIRQFHAVRKSCKMISGTKVDGFYILR